MHLTVQADDHQVLKRYANALAALGEREAHIACARAVNDTTKRVRTAVVRSLRDQTSAPYALIKKQVTAQTIKPGRIASGLEGHVVAHGRPIPIKAFKPRQFKTGVKAKVWGEKKEFRGHFMFGGHYRSQKYIADGHVFENTRGYNSRSKRNNALEKQYGPAIPTEMMKDATKDVFEQIADEHLPKRLEHRIQRAIDKHL